jgi:hypothetical protein
MSIALRDARQGQGGAHPREFKFFTSACKAADSRAGVCLIDPAAGAGGFLDAHGHEHLRVKAGQAPAGGRHG